MKDVFNTAIRCKKDYIVELPNIDIAVQEWGCLTGKPVIALHGWLDNLNSYYPLFSYSDWLEKNNLRVIAIDLAGHGHSLHRHSTHPYYLLEYVQDLYDLIEYFKFDKVMLLGHSMGSAISGIFAGTFPERVSKLMLIEGLGPMTHTEEEGLVQLAKSITQRNRHKNRENQYYDDLNLIINARAKVSELDEENVKLLVERNMRKTEQGYHWRSDPRLRLPSSLYLTPKQVQAFNKNLTMPVTLLYGKQGFIHKYLFMKERIHDCQQIILKELDGGHHLHMEHPEQVIKALSEFINKVWK